MEKTQKTPGQLNSQNKDTNNDNGPPEEINFERVANSTEGELSQQCPICLRPFTDSEEVGIPDTCSKHICCVSCLKEWTKNVKKCPVDRQAFSFIYIKKYLSDDITKKISIYTSDIDSDVEIDVEGDAALCASCYRTIGDDQVLKCVACDDIYHIDCSNLPATSAQSTEYFCHMCISSTRFQLLHGWISESLVPPNRNCDRYNTAQRKCKTMKNNSKTNIPQINKRASRLSTRTRRSSSCTKCPSTSKRRGSNK